MKAQNKEWKAMSEAERYDDWKRLKRIEKWALKWEQQLLAQKAHEDRDTWEEKA